MATTFELLRTAHQTASYMTLPPAAVKELYDLSYKFIISSTSRTLNPTDMYTVFELHFYLALISGNERDASYILKRMTDRFGAGAPRVVVLRALYLEVTETPAAASEHLDKRGTEADLLVRKRKIAILKSSPSAQSTELVAQLLTLVDTFAADAESWAELARLYTDAGLFAQALFALHEVLLIFPLAYNVNALIGETCVQYAATLGTAGAAEEKLIEATKFFLRAVELCDDYVRGWAGVLIASLRITQLATGGSSVAAKKKDALYKDLAKLARSQLQKIVDTNDAHPEDLAAAALVLKSY
ncbi:uncharacterized protein V1518DRAFT_410406 [Limtongia smithiae]|uniref:uncharacterized protein n=1 Tax=Limtongia smithiae TaxID=1125753 RepID=UPI0034CD96DC